MATGDPAQRAPTTIASNAFVIAASSERMMSAEELRASVNWLFGCRAFATGPDQDVSVYAKSDCQTLPKIRICLLRLSGVRLEQAMDALSEALTSVRMTSAIFYHAECTAPWGFRVPPLETVAHILAPGTERLVSYHLVTEGKAVAEFADATVSLTAGDVLIIPQGDAHTVFNGAPSEFIDSGAQLCRYLSGERTTMCLGGGGETTRFVCGYFGCERHADKLFLAGLPLIKINLRGDPGGEWLESSVRHLVSQAGSQRPGHAVLLAKMAEALFIESLRRYMEQLPSEQTGWLAAARDPVVGAALAALHRRPSHHWTLEGLAAESAASRSVVAERFIRYLGEPPLTYLARWRLQLAVRMLQTTRKTVLQVAGEVGYDSEAAFNRAFKREFGIPPGQFRKANSDASVRASYQSQLRGSNKRALGG